MACVTKSESHFVFFASSLSVILRPNGSAHSRRAASRASARRLHSRVGPSLLFHFGFWFDSANGFISRQFQLRQFLDR